VRDISERRRFEQELRIAEARSSSLLSITTDAIISVDEEQRITHFNEGAEKIFGYARSEVMGAPLDVLIPRHFRAAHRQHMGSFAAHGTGARRMGERSARIFGLRKSGEEFAADAAISSVDVGGAKLLTVALRDISAQRRVEFEQTFLAHFGSVLASTLDHRETAQRIARLIVGDIADVCLVEIVEEPDQQRRRAVAARDQRRATVAHDLQEVQLDRQRPYLGSSVFDTRQPELMSHVSPGYLEWITQSPEHRRMLHEFDPKSLVALPLIVHERVVGTLVAVRTEGARAYDQADVRFLEKVAHRAALAVEKARLYDVAQRAIKARDDVLGIVAHDLRNPLNTILMQVGLLGGGAGSDPRARKLHDGIERAVKRMNRLIQDLLDVTRMERGRLSLEKGRVSARQAMADSLQAEESLATQASVELRLEAPHDLPEVWADRERLLQVFENLIGNAIKFTGAGGTIEVGAEPREGEVLFWVVDTGAGIDTEHLPHIFERFWQGRGERHRGAGLGLPIVKGIVEAHGGRVWVESTVGRGTTFFFTLPAAARAEDRRQEPAPLPH
jgi:PAS domain S-box-containing protein